MSDSSAVLGFPDTFPLPRTPGHFLQITKKQIIPSIRHSGFEKTTENVILHLRFRSHGFRTSVRMQSSSRLGNSLVEVVAAGLKLHRWRRRSTLRFSHGFGIKDAHGSSWLKDPLISYTIWVYMQRLCLHPISSTIQFLFPRRKGRIVVVCCFFLSLSPPTHSMHTLPHSPQYISISIFTNIHSKTSL